MFITLGNPPQDKYQKIEPGHLCTSQSLDEIRDETECKDAAERLGLPWARSYNRPNDFPGCFFRIKVFFNTTPRPARTNFVNFVNSAAICRIPRY